MLRFVSYSVLLILCIHYKFSFSQSVLKQDRILSSNELRQDLLFLKNKLETLHPNLYLYSSKTEFSSGEGNYVVSRLIQQVSTI